MALLVEDRDDCSCLRPHRRAETALLRVYHILRIRLRDQHVMVSPKQRDIHSKTHKRNHHDHRGISTVKSRMKREKSQLADCHINHLAWKERERLRRTPNFEYLVNDNG